MVTAAIPNQGVYQQQQAQAETAYNEAVANLNAKKNGIYQQYGFLPNGQVDPHSNTGMYQEMRHHQGVDLNAAFEAAHDRGLGDRGLGAQVQEAPRFDQQVESANLMRDYLGGLHDVDLGKLDALRSKNASILAAKQQQIADAIQRQQFEAQMAAASGGGAGGGGGGMANGVDWLPGTKESVGGAGYSDESVAGAINAFATKRGWGADPKNGRVGLVVQDGIHYDGGHAYVLVKFWDGHGYTTERVDLGAPDNTGGGQDSAPQQTAASAVTPVVIPSAKPFGNVNLADLARLKKMFGSASINTKSLRGF